MMDLTCLNTIITDNLAVHIDLTSNKSWNLNTGFTSVSLSKWNKAISDDIFLYDFGLTAYDNGRVNNMLSTLSILPTDQKLTLYRVGFNNETGGTFYTGYGITGVTGSTIITSETVITGGTGGTGTTVVTGSTYYGPFTGNFFDLNGGYLQGFFKLKNYKHELLPPRYGSGITIETIVRITPESFNDGYFLFMGARAEDKYVPQFSGECITITATTTAATVSSYYTTTDYKTITELQFSGVTTSEDHYLNNYIDTEILQKGSSTPDLFKNEPIASDDLGRNGNTIGFCLTSEGRIGYTRINPSGYTEFNESLNRITATGWTIIDIVFKPYDIILDRRTLDCAPSRKGDFVVYVNGRRFWKIADFDEYYFKGFKTQREKQLGVPYNISWGGGTFGLKHSYHWDLKKYVLFDENTNPEIASGFTFTTDPFWNDPTCPVPPLPDDISGTTITGDTTTFVSPVPCETGTTANTVMRIQNYSTPHVIITGTTGSTGGTGTTIVYSANTLNQYNILYTTDLDLISNRDYVFTVNVYEENIFGDADGVIGMFFSGQTDIEIVYEKPYNSIEESGSTWTEIQYRIRTEDNTGKTKVKVGLYMKSDYPLRPDFKVYFDRFIYRGADVLSKDVTKDDQLIEVLYDKSFIGGIQKLRIYDVAFTSQQVLHNAMIEARNTAYGFEITKGGRIIYR